MIMTYSHAKVQSQKSIGFEDRMETNGQTDGCDYITFLTNVVRKRKIKVLASISRQWYEPLEPAIIIFERKISYSSSDLEWPWMTLMVPAYWDVRNKYVLSHQTSPLLSSKLACISASIFRLGDFSRRNFSRENSLHGFLQHLCYCEIALARMLSNIIKYW